MDHLTTDDYIVSTVRRLRAAGVKGSIHAFISCYDSAWTDDVLIVSHQLKVEHESNKLELNGNDLAELADKMVALFNLPQTPPNEYALALPAPAARLQPSSPIDLDDDIPF